MLLSLRSRDITLFWLGKDGVNLAHFVVNNGSVSTGGKTEIVAGSGRL